MTRFETLYEALYVILTCIALPFLLYTVIIPGRYLFVVYWVINIAFGLTGTWIMTESICGIFGNKKNATKVSIDLEGNGCEEGVLIIIPAFLNNEKAVLTDTLTSFSELIHSCPIVVYVCYNMIDDESTLKFERNTLKIWDGLKVKNICFVISKNVNGNSKAENINYALDQTVDKPFSLIGIYDADHQPDINCLSYGIDCINKRNCDVVQGQCCIRNHSLSLLSRVVAIEFIDMYNIGHQGRSVAFDLGIFGGSNALWKSKVLRSTRMDPSMLTEDIDSSFKASSMGARICYCPQMLSYELAPVTLRVLTKQRLRWAQGWFEVSIRYGMTMLASNTVSLRRKVGCILLLIWREIFMYLLYHPIFLLVGEAIQQNGVIAFSITKMFFSIVFIVAGLFKTNFIYFVAPKRIRKELHWSWFVVYIFIYPIYSSYINGIQVASHIRHFIKIKEWIPTTR